MKGSQLAAILLACIAMKDTFSTEAPHIASEDLQMTKTQIDALRSKALDGDLASSNELEKYYGVYVADDIQSEFWMRLSGELGDCNDISELIRRAKARNSFATKRESSALQTEYWQERWVANSCVDDK